MQRIRGLVKNLLYYWDIEIAELQSILAIILLAVFLLFGLAPPNSSLYLVTPKIFGLELLTLVVFAIAILHFIGLSFDELKLRRASSLVSCALWTYLTVAIWRRHDMFAILSLTFVLSSGLVYLRLTKILERLQKNI